MFYTHISDESSPNQSTSSTVHRTFQSKTRPHIRKGSFSSEHFDEGCDEPSFSSEKNSINETFAISNEKQIYYLFIYPFKKRFIKKTQKAFVRRTVRYLNGTKNSHHS